MTTLKKQMRRVPALASGCLLLYLGFANLADLPSLQTTLADQTWLPFWMEGACILMIPGLQLTLGATLLAESGKNEKRGAASLLGCLLFLTVLSFLLYAALKPAGRCGACPKLTESAFDYEIWREIAYQLFGLLSCAVALFMTNTATVEPEI